MGIDAPMPTNPHTMEIDDFVTVIPPIAAFITPLYRAKYAIFRDALVKDIIAFAKENPEVFVFPFATKSIEEMHDYSKLRYYRLDLRRYIVRPMYVGNLSPVDEAIRQFIALCMGPDSDEVKRL